MNKSTANQIEALSKDEIIDLLAAEYPDTAPCKGHVFRARVNTYYHQGVFREDRRLTLLKRESCKGCTDCADWLEECLKEDAEAAPRKLDFLENGAKYKLHISGGSPDYSGWYEDIIFDFIKVGNNHE